MNFFCGWHSTWQARTKQGSEQKKDWVENFLTTHFNEYFFRGKLKLSNFLNKTLTAFPPPHHPHESGGGWNSMHNLLLRRLKIPQFELVFRIGNYFLSWAKHGSIHRWIFRVEINLFPANLIHWDKFTRWCFSKENQCGIAQLLILKIWQHFLSIFKNVWQTCRTFYKQSTQPADDW